MIEYIKGEIAELSPASATIDCNGLGYAVNISLNTYAAIQGKKSCKLYIYEAIREDAYILYGFADKQERELFLLLISVRHRRQYGPHDSFGFIAFRIDKCYQHGECQLTENGERNRFKNSPACDSRFKRQNKNLWNGFRSG